MTAGELFALERTEWLISLWPVWLILIGLVIGMITKFAKRHKL